MELKMRPINFLPHVSLNATEDAKLAYYEESPPRAADDQVIA
jgi:hypothetical protein